MYMLRPLTTLRNATNTFIKLQQTSCHFPYSYKTSSLRDAAGSRAISMHACP